MQTLFKEPRVRALIASWEAYRASFTGPRLYGQLKSDLYQVRNPEFHGARPLSTWPAHLLDPDPDVLAAVEHYFLCRCWVGSGMQPAWQLRVMKNIYDTAKNLGMVPRHNPAVPVTPVTPLQRKFQAEGIRDGEADRRAWGIAAPIVARLPTY